MPFRPLKGSRAINNHDEDAKENNCNDPIWRIYSDR